MKNHFYLDYKKAWISIYKTTILKNNSITQILK